MSEPQSVPPDAPFPGARSQVPHAQISSPPLEHLPSIRGAYLPLNASVERRGHTLTLRLPVRAEETTVVKDVVVRERVVVKRSVTEELHRIRGSVRREELTVDDRTLPLDS